jgi:hypothetical protein
MWGTWQCVSATCRASELQPRGRCTEGLCPSCPPRSFDSTRPQAQPSTHGVHAYMDGCWTLCMRVCGVCAGHCGGALREPRAVGRQAGTAQDPRCAAPVAHSSQISPGVDLSFFLSKVRRWQPSGDEGARAEASCGRLGLLETRLAQQPGPRTETPTESCVTQLSRVSCVTPPNQPSTNPQPKGIGAGFVPAILNTTVYDEVIKVCICACACVRV